MRLSYERNLAKKGYKLAAGVDEVGRGPLAGPIVAAAVILPLDFELTGLKDSKKLSPKKREQFYDEIRKQALAIGLAKLGPRTIDRINIWQANLLVMKMAVEALPLVPDYLLIDGKRHHIDLPIEQRAITGGDGKCVAIAAASVIAKVVRDRMMRSYHHQYPAYGFDRHKGYGTREHFLKLRKFGPSPIHRRTFFPVSTFAGA